MGKCTVLALLGLFVGGMLSFGDGAVLGIPLVLVSAFLLAGTRSRPTRKRVAAAVVALAR